MLLLLSALHWMQRVLLPLRTLCVLLTSLMLTVVLLPEKHVMLLVLMLLPALPLLLLLLLLLL